MNVHVVRGKPRIATHKGGIIVVHGGVAAVLGPSEAHDVLVALTEAIAQANGYNEAKEGKIAIDYPDKRKSAPRAKR